MMLAESETMMMNKEPEDPNATPAPSANLKIIKSGRIAIEVDDLDQISGEISSMVTNSGGYIANTSTYRNDNSSEINLTLRIPADKFDSLVNQISEKGIYLENKQISSRDVTEEFIDVKARLNNKLKLEERLSSLLTTTKNITEILKVETELSRVRAEIESLEGRMRYLSNRVGYSTLYLRLFQIVDNSEGAGSKITDAFVSGFHLIGKILLGLLYIWPLLLIAAVIFIILRVRKTRRIKSR